MFDSWIWNLKERRLELGLLLGNHSLRFFFEDFVAAEHN